ncbi:sensor histidine kinase [Nocardioides lianchengensis]|uniref:histidine kinase n=1 Tax=Nocardioides lianchengensis TaxID=1045774 RepID=A0A1G7BUR5_9ACTN|nr:HAMP domain-containing sensor histidine kinase [Nocardioides lianchengensis]NYG09341.1 signal transduction histidine kinase [Nocardioides lianchengensis]SDE30370.1 Signal transduction histidine kinase [Nocardioides lianchengensis]
MDVRAGAPPGEEAARALLRTVLGPDGVAGTPLITHAEIVATATELSAHLLQVDDCWVQPPGAFAESLSRSAGENGGVWLGNPTLPAAGPLGSVRIRGALGGAPFFVGGERHALMVFTVAPRAWTRADHVVLRQAAAELGSALEATHGHQRTPAQEARARYDELRSELLTVLNHELRTPLAALSAGVEMLADLAEELPVPVGRLVARMEPNLARLLELSANVTTLGDVATPQSRVDTARIGPADAAAVARTCVASLGTAAARVDVHEAGPGVPLVVVPAEDLRELLDRVLSNAVKFSGPDDRVTVTVERRSSRVTVVVADTGVGVPEHEEHAVGQPFYRGSNARALQAQGAGLGLSAATTIARRWGGTVELRPGADGGAVVTVRLPAAERGAP